jgi:hypothetical protein
MRPSAPKVVTLLPDLRDMITTVRRTTRASFAEDDGDGSLDVDGDVDGCAGPLQPTTSANKMTMDLMSARIMLGR